MYYGFLVSNRFSAVLETGVVLFLLHAVPPALLFYLRDCLALYLTVRSLFGTEALNLT